MVDIQEPSDPEKLEQLIQVAAARYSYHLDVSGWTRKTYDVFKSQKKGSASQKMARIESFAATSGEITIYTDEALGFAMELGGELEKSFALTESKIIRDLGTN